MEHSVAATARPAKGGAAARRLRRAGQVPGIVYGEGEPRMIALDEAVLTRQLSQESFHSSILSLELDGAKVPVLLRDFQSHPVNDAVLHVDFQAVAADSKVSMTVPLHFVNADTAPGVKLSHGIFSVIEDSVGVHCLPKDLPENIEVDVGHLEINHSVHLSEVKIPAGVTFDALIRGEDPSIATVLAPKAEAEEQPAAAAAAEEGAAEAAPAAAEGAEDKK
ncbi:MAG: 50S ribosomal protein L25/general stress protein Ctc [Betaproteobacteria bacterium AqS2]|uniref:Large ribosomal subunit protein bL25 n=1 Tax=Candidatus Amphirhobacter heronislandensis TaxID=1732024 RepID=A0A930UID6_9GAMM|nr:50S ribosomal protein L25/general stress protein Ctc [Betaproteobacteria bacterium AqS2]